MDEIVSFLAEGNNINGSNAFGETYLHVAAAVGDPLSLKFLLAKGANANLTDKLGDTILHLAAKFDGTLVELLLVHQADASLTANDGSTPLHVAAAKGNLDGTAQ